VDAYQHQPFPGALEQDGAHPLGGFRIEKGGGFDQYFNWTVAQPGHQMFAGLPVIEQLIVVGQPPPPAPP